MVALFVVLLFVAFVLADYFVRQYTQRMKEKREREKRAAILDEAVRVEYTAEAKSLKRVEVPDPKARILAVDDEPVVLDSFRRILVLEGYNVDTVESGPEALGLLQSHDYDFVFTDLKMAEMDGVEVVKAVKHLRPELDVVVITGYGTIETAVATMQYGACDYVQKPFTAEELAEFIHKLLVKRQARLEAQRQPTVRIVAPVDADSAPAHDYCVPGGAFLAPSHAWARIEPGGQVRIGIDDFARKALGNLDRVLLPEAGREVRQGEILFTLKQGTEELHFAAPLSGKVVKRNEILAADPKPILQSAYDKGWILQIQPKDLAVELPALKIGKAAVAWYQEEIARLRAALAEGSLERLEWSRLEKEFLKF